MDEAKRAQGFLELYKQQMQRFKETQGVEWKANFGVWTLLSATILFVSEHPVTVPRWAAILVCGTAFLGHGCWLFMIHMSQQFDKRLWVRYRQEALLLLREPAFLYFDELESDRREWLWLVVVLWLTGLLSLMLLRVLSTVGGLRALNPFL
jgi:hypothetical protein